MAHHEITMPVTESQVRALAVDDTVTLHGALFGLREGSLAAFKRYGGAYLAVIGGAAALETTWIEQIEDVDLDDLNPESLWKFRVRDFGPLLVAMDSVDGSAYDVVKHDVQASRAQVLQDLGVRRP